MSEPRLDARPALHGEPRLSNRQVRALHHLALWRGMAACSAEYELKEHGFSRQTMNSLAARHLVRALKHEGSGEIYAYSLTEDGLEVIKDIMRRPAAYTALCRMPWACPACGALVTVRQQVRGQYGCACTNMGCKSLERFGPICDTPEEAVAAWNELAAASRAMPRGHTAPHRQRGRG